MNNNNNFITFVFLILTTFTFFSCQKDLYSIVDIDSQESIADAQVWYEENLPQGLNLGFAKVKSNKKKKLSSKPDWNHASANKHADFTAVHVPLSVQGGFTFVTPERKKAYEETKDERFLASFTQMVVVCDKKSGKKTGFLMTIIPDIEYQKAANFKAFNSKYKKWQKGYDGLIFYHTLEGVFTNGWRIANGKVIKSITPKEGGDIDVQLKTPSAQKASSEEGCIDYYYEIWTIDCEIFYTNNEDNITHVSCGDWYISGYIFAYTECNGDGNEGDVIIPGSNGSSGSGDPSGGGTSSSTLSSTATAIIKISNLHNDDINKFNDALQELLDKCSYKAMYDFLIQKGSKFNTVSINPYIPGPAQYDSQQGNLSFQSNSTISTSLQEEFVHLFQNSIYTGGIGQYGNIGKSNIEFEAKLIEDIICTINNMGCAYYASTFSNNADYINWLYIVTNDGTTFPDINTLLVQHQECGGKNYWNFLNDFATNPDKPSYNFPVNSTLMPLGINYININQCE